MGYSTDCFKSYKVVSITGGIDEYELVLEGYEHGDYIYSSRLFEIGEYLNSRHIGFDVVPNWGEVYLGSLSKKEVDHLISTLIEPSKCLQYVEENRLQEIIKVNVPDCLFCFEHLLKRWEQGFYVVLTY